MKQNQTSLSADKRSSDKEEIMETTVNKETGDLQTKKTTNMFCANGNEIFVGSVLEGMSMGSNVFTASMRENPKRFCGCWISVRNTESWRQEGATLIGFPLTLHRSCNT